MWAWDFKKDSNKVGINLFIHVTIMWESIISLLAVYYCHGHILFAFFPFGEGNGNPLQYSCRENPMDGGAWLATVQGSQRVGHNWETSLSCGKLMLLSQKYYTVKKVKKPKVYCLLSEISSFHHHCLPHLNPLQSRTYKLMSILSIYV